MTAIVPLGAPTALTRSDAVGYAKAKTFNTRMMQTIAPMIERIECLEGPSRSGRKQEACQQSIA